MGSKVVFQVVWSRMHFKLPYETNKSYFPKLSQKYITTVFLNLNVPSLLSQGTKTQEKGKSIL